MSQDTVVVDLEERTTLGKGLKGLRASGKVPAVIHDHGSASMHVMGDAINLTKVYSSAGKHQPLELQIGTKKHLALIKDVDYEPVKHQMRHVVFQAIKQNETVEAEIPVHVEGEIPAERTGFMVITHLDHVVVEALPRDLIDHLSVDGTKLVEIGDRLTVSDIVLPSGVMITTDADTPIATVEETKEQVSEEAVEEVAAEGEESPTTEKDKEASEEE